MNCRGISGLLALSSWACGTGIASDGFEPQPLALIRGIATNDAAIETGAEVRAALVWISLDQDEEDEAEVPTFTVAQETELSAEFPARFELAITEVPPEETMGTDPEFPNSRIALADVVIYGDVDGDGHLDLPASALDSFPEPILGVRRDILVVYVEGAPVSFDKYPYVTFPSGFSLRDTSAEMSQEVSDAVEECFELYPDWNDERLDACLDEVDSLYAPRVLPIDTEFELPLSEDPKMPQLACYALDVDDEEDDSIALGETVYTCHDDNYCYDVDWVWTVDPDSAYGLCVDVLWPEDESFTECWPEDSPLPEGWPCPQ